MELEVKNKNKKMTLFFIHGFNSSGLSIKNLLDKDTNFNIVYFNYPTDKVYNTIELAAEIDKAIKRVKGPLVVVGHSLGGAVLTHVKDVRKIKKFIFLSALNPRLAENKGVKLLLSETKTGKVLQKVIAKSVDIFSDGFFAVLLNPPEQWYRFVKENILNKEYLEETLDAAYRTKAKKAVSIIGTSDQLFKYEEYNEYMKEIGMQEQYLVEKGTHPIINEFPNETLEILNKIIPNKNKRRRKIVKGA